MTPRADFACLSRKCRSETEGGAQPELVNLRSSSMATNLDRLAAPEIERMEHRESAAKDARTSGRVGEGFAVPLRQIPATLAKFGGRAPAGQIPGGAADGTPAPGSLHDTRWAIRGGKAVKR